MLSDPIADEPSSTSSAPRSDDDDALTQLLAAPADPAARAAALAALGIASPGVALLKRAEDTALEVRNQALARFNKAAVDDVERALRAFLQVADVAVELDDACARGYRLAGDWSRAERCWLSALWIVDHDFRDLDRQLHYLHLLKVNYLDWGLPHKARDMLGIAARDLYAAGRFTESADTRISQAVIFIEVGQPEDAIATLKEAAATLRRAPVGHPFVLARLLTEDGVAHVLRGSVTAGRNRLRDALAILEDPEQRDLADDQRAAPLAVRVRRHLTELAVPRRRGTRPAGSQDTA